MDGKIGVLALQGAFSKHREMLLRLGVESIEVRTPAQLAQVEGLIIPGGESTTISSLNELPLVTFDKPIFGTCAGMIVMAQLGLLSLTIERNAYGRQIHSFTETITVNLPKPQLFKALFIRAPKVASYSSSVQLLADTPVLLRQGDNLAASFHPELTNDPLIHHYFVEICKEKQLPRQQSKTTPTKSFQMT